MDTLSHILISGILGSGIREEGGQKCYEEIPKDYHFVAATLITVVFMGSYHKWKHTIDQSQNVKKKERTVFQLIMGLLCFLLLIANGYMKYQSKKMMFMLNPCYVALGVEIVLLLWRENTPFLQRLHAYWSSWIFGAFFALIFLDQWGKSSKLEMSISYLWHSLLCFGPFLLIRRYGFMKPTLKNHIVSFSSFALYHTLFLLPIALLTRVNLDFQLCHLPGDPTYSFIGYHYYAFHAFSLMLVSFLIRWLMEKIIFDIQVHFKKYGLK